MTAELDVLQDAVGRLERAGIRYMLTGSIALSYYAEPRMTRDIDLVVEFEARGAREIAELFAPDYYVSEQDVARALAERGMFNVLHLDKLVKLDLIVRKEEPYRRRELERRIRVQLPGFEAWIVSKEDLILSKLVWAKPSRSELQLRDARALLAADADIRISATGLRGSTSRTCLRAASMQDTNPEFRRLVATRYRQLAPAERVRLCTEMFDTARVLVEASLPENVDANTRRRLVCERFYGHQFAKLFEGA